MVYYDDYITEKAAPIIEQKLDDAQFTLYDGEHNPVDDALDEHLIEQMFSGVIREMVSYLYERRRESEDKDGELSSLFDPDNIANIYVTARGLEAPTFIVEYDETPEWFSMENADLREFYWYPNPADSGEWSAGYFQPREAHGSD